MVIFFLKKKLLKDNFGFKKTQYLQKNAFFRADNLIDGRVWI